MTYLSFAFCVVGFILSVIGVAFCLVVKARVKALKEHHDDFMWG